MLPGPKSTSTTLKCSRPLHFIGLPITVMWKPFPSSSNSGLGVCACVRSCVSLSPEGAIIHALNPRAESPCAHIIVQSTLHLSAVRVVVPVCPCPPCRFSIGPPTSSHACVYRPDMLLHDRTHTHTHTQRLPNEPARVDRTAPRSQLGLH
jgi:hypothetical protein